MDEEFTQIEKEIFEEWRQLGFYYELYKNGDVYQWRFFGSKSGFQRFSSLLHTYADDPVNVNLSEHEHFGPYYYLKIMTSGKLPQKQYGLKVDKLFIFKTVKT